MILLQLEKAMWASGAVPAPGLAAHHYVGPQPHMQSKAAESQTSRGKSLDTQSSFQSAANPAACGESLFTSKAILVVLQLIASKKRVQVHVACNKLV